MRLEDELKAELLKLFLHKYKCGAQPVTKANLRPPPPFEGHAHSFVEFRDCLASERIVVVVGFLGAVCRDLK